jgi:hypothetical protein
MSKETLVNLLLGTAAVTLANVAVPVQPTPWHYGLWAVIFSVASYPVARRAGFVSRERNYWLAGLCGALVAFLIGVIVAHVKA